MFAMQQKLHLHELLRQGCNNCKELGNTLNERKPSHEELHVQEIIYKCIVEKFDVIKVMFGYEYFKRPSAIRESITR